jgi:hypothetical protein
MLNINRGAPQASQGVFDRLYGCRDDGSHVRMLDLSRSDNLDVPVVVNGAYTIKNVPTVTVTLEYLGESVWGNGATNAYSNLVNNCWGALTTASPWLGNKYGLVGCNATVGAAYKALCSDRESSTAAPARCVAPCVLKLLVGPLVPLN